MSKINLGLQSVRSPKFILDEAPKINLGLLKKTCVGSMRTLRGKRSNFAVLRSCLHWTLCVLQAGNDKKDKKNTEKRVEYLVLFVIITGINKQYLKLKK
ncbi:hypothetical protein PN36_06940 [Candidatus Thiomargarita nelsonii]|uniref:Uncharacterized protein n=1 Tax=Candidatus Thiomargarita nelsonii TaxID=1003181 RepID=A0A0A6PHQ6_9GAMM|nr:hypothetical protein PN36_06940 [Candidatus Thiomargarita nelsonii]